MPRQPEYRRRQPREMSEGERVEVIARLRQRGWTWSAIGKEVGLSANGAKYCLHRVTQPGRYTEYYEEEVEVGARPEEW